MEYIYVCIFSVSIVSFGWVVIRGKGFLVGSRLYCRQEGEEEEVEGKFDGIVYRVALVVFDFYVSFGRREFGYVVEVVDGFEFEDGLFVVQAVFENGVEFDEVVLAQVEQYVFEFVVGSQYDVFGDVVFFRVAVVIGVFEWYVYGDFEFIAVEFFYVVGVFGQESEAVEFFFGRGGVVGVVGGVGFVVQVAYLVVDEEREYVDGRFGVVVDIRYSDVFEAVRLCDFVVFQVVVQDLGARYVGFFLGARFIQEVVLLLVERGVVDGYVF